MQVGVWAGGGGKGHKARGGARGQVGEQGHGKGKGGGGATTHQRPAAAVGPSPIQNQTAHNAQASSTLHRHRRSMPPQPLSSSSPLFKVLQSHQPLPCHMAATQAYSCLVPSHAASSLLSSPLPSSPLPLSASPPPPSLMVTVGSVYMLEYRLQKAQPPLQPPPHSPPPERASRSLPQRTCTDIQSLSTCLTHTSLQPLYRFCPPVASMLPAPVSPPAQCRAPADATCSICRFSLPRLRRSSSPFSPPSDAAFAAFIHAAAATPRD